MFFRRNLDWIVAVAMPACACVLCIVAPTKGRADSRHFGDGGPNGAIPINVCTPPPCEGVFTTLHTVLPGDAQHCPVMNCCDADGCTMRHIPWVLKADGKTDKWYDYRLRKMVDLSGGE